jgi:hypothetical protein
MRATPGHTTELPGHSWIELDESETAYDAWRSACRLVDAAHGYWSEAMGRSKAAAYVAYTANLDREEAAARHLRSHIEASGAPSRWSRRATATASTACASGDGERSDGHGPPANISPHLWGAPWWRLLTMGAQPPHAGPSTANPHPEGPSR